MNLAKGPACNKAWPKMLGEHMISFRNALTHTTSLKDSPWGAERLRMGLIFVGSSFAINMFAQKLGRGGTGNGPATKRFFYPGGYCVSHNCPIAYCRFSVFHSDSWEVVG